MKKLIKMDQNLVFLLDINEKICINIQVFLKVKK